MRKMDWLKAYLLLSFAGLCEVFLIAWLYGPLPEVVAQFVQTTINGAPPPYTFTGSGVSQTGQTFTFSGGGGLPTATAPGQIIASTGSGTTYAPLVQTFYAQSGDTVASIEAECSSPCAYHVTAPQTITLASTHTLSSTVNLVFEAGGEWTVNCTSTPLTIPAWISASHSQQIFAGSCSILTLNQNTFWDWYGAVNDGAYLASPTGTDNTTAIQASVSGTQPGYCSEPGRIGFYRITSAIAITASTALCIGDPKMTASLINPFALSSGVAAVSAWLMNTSTTANTITLTGTSSVSLKSPIVQNLGIAYPNLVSSSGTATGISDQWTDDLVINNVSINDAIIGTHEQEATNGLIENSAVNWGFGVVTSYTSSFSNLIAFYMDATSGNPSNSIQYAGNLQVNIPGGIMANGQLSTCLLASGAGALHDVGVYYLNCANVTTGINFNITTAASGAGYDLHAAHDTVQCAAGAGTTNGFVATGATTSTPQVTFEEGFASNCTNGVNLTDVASSVVSDMQLYTGMSVGVKLSSSSVTNLIKVACNGPTTCVSADSGSANNFCQVTAPSGNISSNIMCSTTNTPGALGITQSNVPGVQLGAFYNGATGSGALAAGFMQTTDNTAIMSLNQDTTVLNTWSYMNASSNPAGMAYIFKDGSTEAGWAVDLVGAGTGTISGVSSTNTVITCVGVGSHGGGCMINPGTVAPTLGTVAKFVVNPVNTIDNTAIVQFNATAVGNTPLNLQGFSGQTAPLQKWTNSSNTTLASVTANGSYSGPGVLSTGNYVASGQTSATSAQTLVTTTATSTYQVNAVVTCDTSVAAATVTLTVSYTDPSSTAQTLTPSAAVCTTLGAASIANITQTIRAKTGTTITVSAAIANSPNYDIAATALQITSN